MVGLTGTAARIQPRLDALVSLHLLTEAGAGLRVGAVGVNGWSPLAPQLPWGGMKASGVGREVGYEGILANTETKTVTIIL